MRRIKAEVEIEAPAAPSPGKAHALALFAGLRRHYDVMGALLSFGQDPRWRRELVADIDAGSGDVVLDVATGTGLVARELRRAATAAGWSGSTRASRCSPPLARSWRAIRSSARAIELVRGEAERLPVRRRRVRPR